MVSQHNVLSYAYTSPVGGTIIAMDIGIKDQNKVYVISYSAEQPEYHTYIPAVQKMIHSFYVVSRGKWVMNHIEERKMRDLCAWNRNNPSYKNSVV
jgi:hypothetical protein